MKTCVVVGIVASTMFGGLALADRATADKLAKEAHATKDPTTAAACGQAYLDVYNQAPNDPTNDEVLQGAAVCFDEARSIGAALQAIELLRKYHPTSKFIAPMTLRSADLYARVAMHDRAAERFEEFAKKYAGDVDAPDALASAIQLRVAFGIDEDKAIADAALYARTFGAKRPTEAAHLMLDITDVVERKGPDALVAHLQDYLRLKNCSSKGWEGRNTDG
ncbi:MAG: hypothetical protein NT062_04670 [Proteobacteria bacterium]|nr:hypothetical protein [Pseudomonadota bacterium]